MNSSTWWRSGEPGIWLSASAVSASLLVILSLILLLVVRGLAHFWPHEVVEFSYQGAPDRVERVVGEIREQERIPRHRITDTGGYLKATADASDVVERLLIKTGNRRENGIDFRWILTPNILATTKPADMLVLERREWGNAYGYLRSVLESGEVVARGEAAKPALRERLARSDDLWHQARDIEKRQIGAVNYQLDELRLQQRALELDGRLDTGALAQLQRQRADLQAQYQQLMQQLGELRNQLQRDTLVLELASGQQVRVPLGIVVRAYWPNAMSLPQRLRLYGAKLWEFLSSEPREANTEGGVFPAIFGTVVMVLLMAALATPLGVVVAIYLREYARQNWFTRVVRISVNNLAGVPSIVYGIFGLGFFVYFLGGNIDRLFYPEAAPAPVYGTPGLLWASLTLALLTLPVVIVSTEEGLTRIPRSVREGSLALGATKAETLWRIILPMSSPAIMTGMILAIARAAGEVAPLMLVGVVKLAPSLPLDGNAPFLHLDRKFMHLGFHIYDVGFQSPNVEAARPLVYATALLLLLIVLLLNVAAIWVRNRLREKYRALEN